MSRNRSFIILINIVKKEIQRLSEEMDCLYASDQAFIPGTPGNWTRQDGGKKTIGCILAGRQEAVKTVVIVEMDLTVDFRNMTSWVAA